MINMNYTYSDPIKIIRGNNMSSLIANHTSYFRQVRLNADKTVAEIFSIRRTSRDDDPDYQTTYQDPNEGRFALTCNKHSDNIRVFDILNNKPYVKEDAEEFLKTVSPTVLEWLRDASTQRYSNFVPVGFGWDGKFTRAEYQKRQRANMLFVPPYHAGTDIDNDWLQVILDEICRTPKSFLTLRWDDAKAMPLDRTVKLGDGFNKKTFIFIDHAGNQRVQKLKKVIGAVNSHPGIKVPTDINRVIVLTRGVTCDEVGNPSGCGVELLTDTHDTVTVWEV